MQKNLSLRKKRMAPKAILRLPDLDHAKAAVRNSLTSPDAQRGSRFPPGLSTRDGQQRIGKPNGITQDLSWSTTTPAFTPQ